MKMIKEDVKNKVDCLDNRRKNETCLTWSY